MFLELPFSYVDSFMLYYLAKMAFLLSSNSKSVVPDLKAYHGVIALYLSICDLLKF